MLGKCQSKLCPKIKMPCFHQRERPSAANRIVFPLKFNQPNCLRTFSTPELLWPLSVITFPFILNWKPRARASIKP